MTRQFRRSFADRIIARAEREATKVAPLVGSARRHPRSQQFRRDLERVRVAVRLRRTQSADALLDELVAEALAARPELAGASAAAARQERPEPSTQPVGEPLRVGVVAPRSVPAVEGGAERHWASLVRGFNHAGMAAELVSVDCPEDDLAQVLASYRRFLRLDVSKFDVVVSGKYPSWMIRHPRHVRHLNHPLRGLYERYPSHLPAADAQLRSEVDQVLTSGGPEGLIEWALERADDEPFPGPLAQAVVQALDLDAARHIHRHAVVSEHVARRPRYLPDGVEVAVIPPLTDLPPPEPTATEPHIFAFGRQTPIKRLDLTIAGFGAAKRPDLELLIAGDGPEHAALGQLAAAVPGVRMLGHCTDAELQRHLASAIAVIATPEDEDFGLIAAEAHAAGRPVITTSDSGGVAEQIEHEVNGIVVRPNARALGRAISTLADDPALADRLGRAGADQLGRRDWKPMVRLVREAAGSLVREAAGNTAGNTAGKRVSRKRITVLSTFPAEPVRGGGARRLRGVAAALQLDFDVAVMTLTNRVGPGHVRRRVLDDGVRHTLVGRSAAHLSADSLMAALTQLPTDDIGCSRLHTATPSWGAALESELATADAVVLAHPYLASSLPEDLGIPIVYDAHNVEADLKRTLLEGRRGQARLRQWVVDAERAAVERAAIVTATSASDAARLHQLYGGTMALLAANGVDDEILVPADDDERLAARLSLLADLGLRASDKRPIVSFIASNHPPNHDAADTIAEMAEARNDLIVVLAGAHSERPRTGVHNYGRFHDATHRRLLLGSDVALNPVEAGSGTNLKLIEALAVGTPVVSTPTGARGLEHPDSVLMVAELADLSEAIDAVLGDLRTAARVEAGVALATAHRWTETTADLKAALAQELGVPLSG